MPTLSVKDAAGSTQTIQTVPAVGSAASASSLPVVIASDQAAVLTSVSDGGSVSIGAKADTSASSDGGTFSLIALVKRLLGKIPALGSAVSAASLPVVIASDQAAVSVRDAPASLATSQVSVAATATQIAAARAGRKSITIVQEGTTAVRLGGSGVTTGNGVLLPGTAGASFTIDGAAAVFGIVGTGTQLVSYVESY